MEALVLLAPILMPFIIILIGVVGLQVIDKPEPKLKTFDAYELANLFLEASRRCAREVVRAGKYGGQSHLDAIAFFQESKKILDEEENRLQELLTDGEF